MQADEYLKAGQLEEALASVTAQVRTKPGDATLRTTLFQLFSVLGQWERALNQLSVLENMGSAHLLFARIFQPVIQSELLRREIFAGRRSPLFLGEPEEWVSFLLEANQLLERGEFNGAQELRDRAMQAAPATPGRINGTEFTWLADADVRLGPMLELIMEGRYYWVPLASVARFEVESPRHLHDLLWISAKFVWINGGQASGLIPVRYPGTDSSPDGLLRLARKTEWIDQPGGLSVGLGQRILATDVNDYPLLEVRTVELAPAAPA
jgi:type VI secretion system protein ImpE